LGFCSGNFEPLGLCRGNFEPLVHHVWSVSLGLCSGNFEPLVHHVWSVSLGLCSGNFDIPVLIAGKTMSRQLKARLGAVRLLLAEERSPGAHEGLSRLQCNAVVAAVRSAGPDLTSELAAELATMAAQVRWAPGHLEQVLAALTAGSTVAAQPKGRRAQQDFRAVTRYGNEPLWTILSSSDSSRELKLELILQLALGLGSSP
jgi:hypothetical protein